MNHNDINKRSSYPISLGILCVIFVFIFIAPLSAQDSIPKESGFSGFIRPGAGLIWSRSNLIAGNTLTQFGNPTISSLEEYPKRDFSVFPIINLYFQYTFKKNRTQLFFGNELEDLLRFEMTVQFGIAHEFKNVGTFSFGYILSSMPTRVWSDPYLLNEPRTSTVRKSPGLRIAWNKIFNTHFQLKYTLRNFYIDNEQSGTSLDSFPDLRGMLSREGNGHSAHILYRYYLNKKHIFVPAAVYHRFDMNGSAMSNNVFGLQLTYSYIRSPIVVIANVLTQIAQFDEVNPLFIQTRRDMRYGITGSIYYKNPFGWKPLKNDGFIIFSSLVLLRSNSNIEFYRTYVETFSLGCLFKF